MVSFNCDRCGDVVKKQKLAQHYGRCRAPVTCLDCSQQFMHPKDAHTSCISEDEKYQKRYVLWLLISLYKGKKQTQQKQKQNESNDAQKQSGSEQKAAKPKKRENDSEKESSSKRAKIDAESAKEEKRAKKKERQGCKKEQASSKNSVRAAEACSPAALRKLLSKLGSKNGVSLSEVADHIEKNGDIKRSRINAALLALRFSESDGRLFVCE